MDPSPTTEPTRNMSVHPRGRNITTFCACAIRFVILGRAEKRLAKTIFQKEDTKTPLEQTFFFLLYFQVRNLGVIMLLHRDECPNKKTCYYHSVFSLIGQTQRMDI
mmetsp:Transcript_11248/g.11342  ORF Transcript_11248/g.11342 Transcript_11248/m.11342 type:complete len:106 (-) Transcript_11248:179-496(-)